MRAEHICSVPSTVRVAGAFGFLILISLFRLIKENEMAHPATKKRGGNPDVKHKPKRQKPKDAMERKLERGLEESMAGSDPASVTQPSTTKHHEKKEG